MPIKDPRLTQILILGTFLILGVSTRDWTVQPYLILVAIATCLVTQWLLSAVKEYSKGDRDFTPANFFNELNILICPQVLTSNIDH